MDATQLSSLAGLGLGLRHLASLSWYCSSRRAPTSTRSGSSERRMRSPGALAKGLEESKGAGVRVRGVFPSGSGQDPVSPGPDRHWNVLLDAAACEAGGGGTRQGHPTLCIPWFRPPPGTTQWTRPGQGARGRKRRLSELERGRPGRIAMEAHRWLPLEANPEVRPGQKRGEGKGAGAAAAGSRLSASKSLCFFFFPFQVTNQVSEH